VPLFWLNYRHPNGRAAGVVVIEFGDLLFNAGQEEATSTISTAPGGRKA